MTPTTPWYRRYSELQGTVENLRKELKSRCDVIGVPVDVVMREFRRELVARAVHESNWQEGIELSSGRTRELATSAFDELDGIAGPHLDIPRVLRSHRDRVVQMKKEGHSHEELATYNLAVAHQALEWIGTELANRQTAAIAQCLEQLLKAWPGLKLTISEDKHSTIEHGLEVLRNLRASSAPIDMPLSDSLANEGELVTALIQLDPHVLASPMKIAYVHLLHKLTLMSVLPVADCGRFRRSTVHVGNPDLHFPVPAAVPGLMEEYCEKFPAILPTAVKYDPIRVAAGVSHRFVAIHPYVDGNGRVARLLMNLVLWKHHPPVYLKADKKGRHRYSQALRRADRGSVDALASLIAMSLVEIYETLLRSLQHRNDGPGAANTPE